MKNSKSEALTAIGSHLFGSKLGPAIMTLLVATVGGVYQQGMIQGWWGFLEGPLEKTSRVMYERHVTSRPEKTVQVIDEPDDHLYVEIFPNGDAKIVRKVTKPDGSLRQSFSWSPKVQIAKQAGLQWSLAPLAYAGQDGSRDANSRHRDAFLGWVSDGVARVRRDYVEDGCWEVIHIVVWSGDILKQESAGCKEGDGG